MIDVTFVDELYLDGFHCPGDSYADEDGYCLMAGHCWPPVEPGEPGPPVQVSIRPGTRRDEAVTVLRKMADYLANADHLLYEEPVVEGEEAPF
jgi:hypothetical protein